MSHEQTHYIITPFPYSWSYDANWYLRRLMKWRNMLTYKYYGFRKIIV